MSQLSDLSPSDIESVGKDMEDMRAMPDGEAELMRFRDDMKRALKESKLTQRPRPRRRHSRRIHPCPLQPATATRNWRTHVRPKSRAATVRWMCSLRPRP